MISSDPRKEGRGLIRIGLDTCTLFSAIIERRPAHLKYFEDLYNQNALGLIELVIPKFVAAELYGILRAGRTKRLVNGEWKQAFHAHGDIVAYLSEYPSVFDPEYLESLDQYNWPDGKDSQGVPLYKGTLHRIVYEEYGWSDWGQQYIEEHTLRTVKQLRIDDRYDYPVMACAIFFDLHMLVTDNLKNFARPTKYTLVMNLASAVEFDHHSEFDEE